MEGKVLSGAIFGFCALIMVVIGISQIRSRDPVGFYTGETAPDKGKITDVDAWNRKHGTMWILYGACLVLTWAGCVLAGDSTAAMIPIIAGTLLPIVPMILYHRYLVRTYMKDADEKDTVRGE